MGGQNAGEKVPITEEQLQKILALANVTKHGSITLNFQNGLLIQIDHSEKIRVDRTKE